MPSASTSPEPGTPVSAFYQEVVLGDLKKFNRQSNSAKSGGGARDLRISPVGTYWDPLANYFPTQAGNRTRKGKILSKVSSDKVEEEEVEFMKPTGARKNECRICRIYTIKNWNITTEEFESKSKQGHKWFFLLVLDDKNQVWATKFCTDVLDDMGQEVKKAIEEKMAQGKKRTIRNFISLK